MVVTELRAYDRVILYGTIVIITGTPYRCGDGLGDACKEPEGWVHVPMIWDGMQRCVGELGSLLVAVSRQPLP